MITQPIFIAAAGGVVTFLTLCSLIGMVLARRVETLAAQEPAPEAADGSAAARPFRKDDQGMSTRQQCKLFGRTKLSPAVSPSKTVEGLVGGGLTAVLIGAALFRITPFSPLQAAAMSAVIVIGGFFGGFVLSAIKRDLGVKDWGRMIEGHGGVLDRMDSVSFASPLFFHLKRYYFAA
jgi:Cytidylyltransferase family